jgi:hypothetical protein
MRLSFKPSRYESNGSSLQTQSVWLFFPTTVYMFMTNRHRDRTYGPANKEASNEAGMRDATEFENKDFRYVL